MRRPHFYNKNFTGHSPRSGWGIIRILKWIFLIYIFISVLKMIPSGGGTYGVSPRIVSGAGINSQEGYNSGSAHQDSDIASVDATPLIKAAIAGDNKKVAKLLLDDIPVNGRDSENRTALMAAAYHGKNSLCSQLIKAGAGLYLQDKQGFNALDFAAARGLVQTVNLLLKESGSPDQSNHTEYAMLMQAAFSANKKFLPSGNGNLRSVNRISPEDKSPLHVAASAGDEIIVQELIRRGAKVDFYNSVRQTPLHWAAWSGKTHVVNLLIKKSAYVNAQDSAGMTPLMFAAQKNHREAVGELLKNGADKEIRNKNGENAGEIAIKNGFLEAAELLNP